MRDSVASAQAACEQTKALANDIRRLGKARDGVTPVCVAVADEVISSRLSLGRCSNVVAHAGFRGWAPAFKLRRAVFTSWHQG